MSDYPSGSSEQPPPTPPPPSGGPDWAYRPLRPTDAFGRPLADWWKRLVAIIIDGIVVGIPINIAFAAAGIGPGFGGSNSSGQVAAASTSRSPGLYYAVVSLVPLIYFALLDGSNRGQTLGKMILRIATRDAGTGGAIGHGRALVRRFVYEALFWIFIIPGVINGLSPLWDQRRQAWHDKIVNSVVIDVS